jgi:hypothetical protein
MVGDTLAMERKKGKQVFSFHHNHYTSVGFANKTNFSFRDRTWYIDKKLRWKELWKKLHES